MVVTRVRTYSRADWQRAETLWGEHAATGLRFGAQTVQVIDAQPYFGVALSPE